MKAPIITSSATSPQYQTIVKGRAAGGVEPNLRDYSRAWSEFSWDDARHRLDGLPGDAGLNIAHEALDRHTAQLHGNRVAIRWIARSGERRDFTYDALRGLTSRFANVVTQIGIRKGNVVATLAGWAFTSCGTRSVRTWRCVGRRCGRFRNSRDIRTWQRRSAICT